MISLNIHDRFILINVLPEMGNRKELEVVQNIKDKIKITDDEIIRYNIKKNETKLTWDKNNPNDNNFDITNSELHFIKNIFNKLNHEKKLHISMLSLDEKLLNLKEK